MPGSTEWRIRLEVFEIPLKELNGHFDLILANLRFPTLVHFAKKLSSLLTPRGKLVVSGFRSQEMEILLPEYEKAGLSPIFENSVQDWMVLVFSPARRNGLNGRFGVKGPVIRFGRFDGSVWVLAFSAQRSS